ncbi:MAG: methionine--tRNA ligase [Bacteriovoracaceae bacterium]|nr:methionine--tRNA ligase [Bacteriovoracaceae bacterium]
MKYLNTSALPYANGPLHFGHIAGVYLPADIFTRHKKLKGERAIHISGSDEHGVAIMQNAQKAGRAYQDYVNDWHKTHKDLFDRYQIQFDFFGQTSSEYHKEETLKWFNSLNEKGMIEKRAEKQLQCQDCHNMLPDRFVEGECYVCGYKEARGDECPDCGTWIEPLKLINPTCKFCNSKNVKAIDSYQWYLLLSKYHAKYKDWFKSKLSWRKSVVPFVDSLSKDELVDRAITRDLDWGIDVPLPEAKGKKLYVWFDAPIGYVSNTKKWLETIGSKEDYIKDWWQNSDTTITNFIGKDNIIFHAIIFPVMSMASGIVNPVNELPANQYVNLEGKQFSKSKGWYVDAEEAMNLFGPDALRFYLTSLIPETSDSSFTWKGFELKINSELANNLGNFVNRAMKFLASKWPEGIPASAFEAFAKEGRVPELEKFIKEQIALLDGHQIKKGQEHIMELGAMVNLFITEKAPWTQFKTDPSAAAETIATSSLYTLALGVMLAPYVPGLSEKILGYFNLKPSDAVVREIYQGKVSSLQSVFANGFKLTVAPEGLVPKIDPKLIAELDEKLKAKQV